MPPGHLVARLNTTFHGHVNLDHFQNARCQVIALGNLALLFFETGIKSLALLFQLLT